MNWEAIGAIGEVVGALAVVITLLFLSRQLRQNTRTVRKAHRSQVAESVSNSISVMQNPEFARIMVIALNDSHSLNSEERVVFGSFILRILRIWEDAYFQWLEGDYETGRGARIECKCWIRILIPAGLGFSKREKHGLIPDL